MVYTGLPHGAAEATRWAHTDAPATVDWAVESAKVVVVAEGHVMTGGAAERAATLDTATRCERTAVTPEVAWVAGIGGGPEFGPGAANATGVAREVTTIPTVRTAVRRNDAEVQLHACRLAPTVTLLRPEVTGQPGTLNIPAIQVK